MLGQRELGQQVISDTCTALVPWEEVIAEGLDDVIEGTRHVRGARLGQEGEQAVEQAEGGADVAAIGSLFGRRSEETAEELIGAVYEVDLQLRRSCWSTSSSRCDIQPPNDQHSADASAENVSKSERSRAKRLVAWEC